MLLIGQWQKNACKKYYFNSSMKLIPEQLTNWTKIDTGIGSFQLKSMASATCVWFIPADITLAHASFIGF